MDTAFRKIKLSIKLKLIAIILFIIALISIFSSFFIIEKQSETLTEEVKKRGILLLNMLATDASSTINVDELSLFQSVNSTRENQGIEYVVILDTKGKVIAKDPYLDVKIGSINKDPFIEEALKTDKDYLIRDAKWKCEIDKCELDANKNFIKNFFIRNILKRTNIVKKTGQNVTIIKDIFDMAKPIYIEFKFMNKVKKGAKLGVVRIGFSKEAVNKTVKESQSFVILFTIIGLFIGFILAYITAVLFIRPVNELVKGTRRISKGDLDTDIVIKTSDEMAVLASTFNAMQKDIKVYMKEMAEKEAMHKELQLASAIQKGLLPSKMPEHKIGDIAAISNTATEVGGDYYDFFPLKEKLGIVLCDVSGHGLAASLIMVMIRTIFRTIIGSVHSPAKTIKIVNRIIKGSITEDKFATMFYLFLSNTEKSIEFSNAAHLPLIQYVNRTGEIQKLDTEGLPIGLIMDSTYEEKKQAVESGDILVLYTDGITEAPDINKEQFGMNRLIDIIKREHEKSAKEILSSIMNEVNKHTAELDDQSWDDVTLIVIKIK